MTMADFSLNLQQMRIEYKEKRVRISGPSLAIPGTLCVAAAVPLTLQVRRINKRRKKKVLMYENKSKIEVGGIRNCCSDCEKEKQVTETMLSTIDGAVKFKKKGEILKIIATLRSKNNTAVKRDDASSTHF